MKKQTTATPIRFRRKPLITALEPRILLDGAAVATTAEMTTDVAYQDDAVHTESAEQSVHFAAPAPTGSEPSARREVAFVDTSVEDHQSLIDGLGEGVEVILIDGSGNGLEQMVAALQGQTGIDAIHLFSHGDVGELKLGTLTLNDSNLQANAELLSTLGESLTESGDLMLYGCYVGADSEGRDFIDSVSSLTQADVAASEDLTGAADLGGDWELEAESGIIETTAFEVVDYAHVLVNTDFGLLLDSNSTWIRPTPGAIVDGDSSYGTFQTISAGSEAYNYAFVKFIPIVTGAYDILVTQSGMNDPMIFLYGSAFDSANPTNDFIVGDDDSGDDYSFNTSTTNLWPGLNDITLQAGTEYHLVMSSYSTGDAGVIDFRASGPDLLTIISGTLANQPPVASNDARTTSENNILNASVPTATDSDGSIATYALASNVSSGTLNFSSNGSYSFNPGSAFDDLGVGESRTVSFTYTATDNEGGVSSPATISVTVTGTNDAPTVSAASVSTTEDVTFSSSVSASDIDGNIVSYELLTDVASGSLTFNSSTGAYSFVPGASFNDLAQSESRQVTFSYRATDNSGAVSGAATVTITIYGTNDAPIITADIADIDYTESGDASAQDLLTSGTLSFDDIDTTDVVDITSTVNTAAAWSAGVIDPALKSQLEAGLSISGTDEAAPGSVGWSYSIADADLDFLAAGETLTLTYRVTVTDSEGATATDDVTITITGTNDAPTITAAIADIGYTESGDASAQDLLTSGTLSFDDIDTTDVVDITSAVNTAAAWSAGVIDPALKSQLEAGLSISGTDVAAPGSVGWSYSIADADLDFLAAGETLTLTYRVTVTDSEGATATDDVTITITGTNDAPTITAAIADIGYTESGDASAQDLLTSGTLSFDDIDTTDVVDITSAVNTAAAWSAGVIDPALKSQLEAGLSISGTDVAAPGSVGWSYSIADADLDFLAAGETLTLTYRVTVTDSMGATATDDVTITITGTNDAPTITAAIADIGYTESGDASAQDLLTNGTLSFDDIDTTDVVDITSAVTTPAAWSAGVIDPALKSQLEAGLSISGTDEAAPGSVGWSYSIADADLDFLAAGETLTLTYRVTVTDSMGATATDDVTITITGTNDAPTITAAIADIGYTEGGDASAQDLLTSGTLGFDDIDTTDVVDVTSAVNTAAAWSAGVIDPALKSQLEAGLSISGTDVAAPGSVGWNYSIADADLDFLAAGETLTLTYRVTVTDSMGATATDDVTITITGTNDGPEVSADNAGPFTESDDASAQALSDSGNVVFTDKDLTDDIDISYASNDDIAWARQDSSAIAALPADLVTALVNGFSVGAENQSHDGQVNWTYTVVGADLDFLNAGDTITFSYTVTAEDSQGATDEAVVTVTLVGTNDAPEVTARVLTDDETIVQQGADYTLEVASLFSDKDSTLSREDLDFNITGLPAGLSYNPETGVISGKSTESGLFTITVTATDVEGASVNRTYEMLVTAVVQNETPTSPADSTPPAAPETDTQPVETQLSGLPDGLVDNSGSTTDTTGDSGFMAPATDTGSEPTTDIGLDTGSEGDELDTDAGEPVNEPQEGDSQTDTGVEKVVLSEPGALVVETQNLDGNTSTRASIDVNVAENGEVVFSDIQQEAFGTVSMAVVSIDVTADNELTVEIQDSSPTAGSQLYSGSLGSGESLPSWISLDPNTGSVALSNPPAGQKEVTIRIQAIGADGQARTLELKLDLEELFERSAVVEGEAADAGDADTAGFVPLSDQLEAELAARDQYGDRLMALLHSA